MRFGDEREQLFPHLEVGNTSSQGGVAALESGVYESIPVYK